MMAHPVCKPSIMHHHHHRHYFEQWPSPTVRRNIALQYVGEEEIVDDSPLSKYVMATCSQSFVAPRAVSSISTRQCYLTAASRAASLTHQQFRSRFMWRILSQISHQIMTEIALTIFCVFHRLRYGCPSNSFPPRYRGSI